MAAKLTKSVVCTWKVPYLCLIGCFLVLQTVYAAEQQDTSKPECFLHKRQDDCIADVSCGWRTCGYHVGDEWIDAANGICVGLTSAGECEVPPISVWKCPARRYSPERQEEVSTVQGCTSHSSQSNFIVIVSVGGLTMLALVVFFYMRNRPAPVKPLRQRPVLAKHRRLPTTFEGTQSGGVRRVEQYDNKDKTH